MLKRIFYLIFLGFLCLFITTPLQDADLVVNLSPSNGDSILIGQENFRDIILTLSNGEWVMLSPGEISPDFFNSIIPVPPGIIQIDYTLPPSLHYFSTKGMKWFLFNHLYIVQLPELTFAYMVDVTYERLTMLEELSLYVDVLKISCIDETLMEHSLFKKGVNALIINACPLSKNVLESLYVAMIDLYILKKDAMLYLHSEQGILNIVELPFEKAS